MIRLIVKRPVLVAMILTSLCLLGVVSYYQLSVELIPYAELPLLIVPVMAMVDADPDFIERNAVIPLEGAISQLDNIERIESYISRQRTLILVYYRDGTNLKYAYLRLSEQVDAIRADFDEQFFASVWKIDTEQLANQFMSIQARGSGGLDQIRRVIDDEVLPQLESIDGIANVEVYGGRAHSVEVILDEAALDAHQLTVSGVSQRISQGSIEQRFLGHVYDGRRRFFVNLVSEYDAVTAIEDVIIKPDGPLRLKHIATIEEGGKERESISRINGKEAITISLIRDSQANLLELSSRTRDKISKLNQELTNHDVELVVDNDSAEIIADNIGSIKQLALIGGLLAVVILWVFLRNLRLVLTVAAAIPISILISLNVLYALDVTINTLSVIGMAIAIGMLLDNSVVVLENIHRLLALGRKPLDAVVKGASEVWRPVLAATLTTICVFMPFIYSDNFLIKTLGYHIGVSIITTLVVSLAVAFLLIPSVTYRILNRSSAAQRESFNRISQYNRSQQLYTLLLKSCLRFPARTVILTTVFFFVSIIIALAVSINVSEEVELDRFNLYVQYASGTTLQSADEQTVTLEQRLIDLAEVDEMMVNINEDNAVFTFKLKEDYREINGSEIGEIKQDILDRLSDAVPTAEVSYQQPTGDTRYRGVGGGGGRGAFGGGAFMRLLGIGSAEERVVIRGEDELQMRNLAEDIRYNLDNLESVERTAVSVSLPRPEIMLPFDKAALEHFDVSTAAVISELSAFRREYSPGISMQSGADEIEIVLTSQSLEEKESDDLRELDIPTRVGGKVPLTQLTPLVYGSSAAGINRVNQQREIEVTYSFAPELRDSKELLEAARTEVEQIVGTLRIAPGLSVDVVHDETDYSEFYFLILAAFVLIFMILASAFESLSTPVGMMFTIPLATIGALWGLILTGNSLLNANVLIGMLILLGVVVNNGIILLDYAGQKCQKGVRLPRSLLEAGQARVRPILITAVTTIIAMLPLAMGKMEYVRAIGAPFAITVIGGLIAGTLFTLVFVPTVFSGIESALSWWRRLRPAVKITQIAVIALGSYLIYREIDSLLWQIIDLSAILAVVPSVTYFIQTSLRRASTDLIPATEPVGIVVRNITKNYDDFSRFVTEFRKPERQRVRLEREGLSGQKTPLVNLLWQSPLYLFLCYFCYSYLDSDFWFWIFTHVVFIYTITVARPYLTQSAKEQTPVTRAIRLRKISYKLIYWGLPLVNISLYFKRWESTFLAVMATLIWLAALSIYATSQKLHREQTDVNRLSGRFKSIRKLFYRLVLKTPLIGKRRRPFRALNRVSMKIDTGMFGLVGPNGAGKTTLMRIICGILEQSRGIIEINGLSLTAHREEFQALIGYLPQEFGTYGNMTAREFLDYQAMLKGVWGRQKRRETVAQAIAAVHLEDNADRKIKTFSGGMRQRVGIAQTLLHLPRILVVDEPTAGLDPRERIRFRNLLSELARDRIVIFSTHIIEDISSSCNHVAVLDEGEVKYLGSPREMTQLAEGCVWQAQVNEERFTEIRKTLRIVHHSQFNGGVRVRVLSQSQPLAEARKVLPTLEDSYLWLIGKERLKQQ